jgi:hypothetical protein
MNEASFGVGTCFINLRFVIFGFAENDFNERDIYGVLIPLIKPQNWVSTLLQ